MVRASYIMTFMFVLFIWSTMLNGSPPSCVFEEKHPFLNVQVQNPGFQLEQRLDLPKEGHALLQKELSLGYLVQGLELLYY